MTDKLPSRAVEKALDISGSYLRKLVRSGVINPERDSSGRFIYSQADVDNLIAYRSKIIRARHQCEDCE